MSYNSLLKDTFYAGLVSLLQTRSLYYFSSVGAEYSSFTDEGQEAVKKFIEFYAYEIVKHEQILLNERAKELVINDLKS